MKVKFKNMLNHFTGKCDGIIYYYHPVYNRVLARREPRMPKTAANERMGRIARRLRDLQVSEGYRDDLRSYAWASRAEHPGSGPLSWVNVLNRLFWSLSRQMGIDLEEISRQQIIEQNLPVSSVKAAVEAGLLEPVQGWQNLIREM